MYSTDYWTVMDDLVGHSFSPKELAAVVGVSQSSIKRWVDAGHIPVTRTAGGHRRISRNAALHFIRSKQMTIVRPDLLGIPDLRDVARPIESAKLSGEFLHGLMLSGKTEQVRRAVTAAFLAGAPIGELFDDAITEALARVGEIWKTDQRGVFIEHGATSIIIEVISHIAALMGPPDDDAPLAVGGAPQEDPHIIPSQMVATTLLDSGWRTINMGPNTPVHAISDAVDTHLPQLVWLAVKSRLHGRELEDLVQLAESLLAEQMVVVVGGREAQRTREHWPEGVQMLD
ncbi:MAG: excisionase family DNA-binding protein, partial [Rhodothermales bacterium]|nr:excisionase family DNA-binding protein [Rhodothermales bacterium]